MRSHSHSFQLDRDGPRLVRDGLEVPLEPRALDLLCYLADHPGRLLRKDELISRVWNAQALTDGVLSNAVAKLRKAFGQGARDREPIETVRGRGYRFHAAAVLLPLPAATLPPPAPPVHTLDSLAGREAIVRLLEECLERMRAGSWASPPMRAVCTRCLGLTQR